jgi:hypothetical protein
MRIAKETWQRRHGDCVIPGQTRKASPKSGTHTKETWRGGLSLSTLVQTVVHYLKNAPPWPPSCCCSSARAAASSSRSSGRRRQNSSRAAPRRQRALWSSDHRRAKSPRPGVHACIGILAARMQHTAHTAHATCRSCSQAASVWPQAARNERDACAPPF